MLRSTIALVFALGLACHAAHGAEPGDEPFATPAQDILKAGRGLSDEDAEEAAVLLEERRYDIDENGRITRTTRFVYHLRSQEGVDHWNRVETSWAPFHQARPSVRARVIEPDGTEHQLDPATIDDAPASDESDLFNDQRLLRAPLPHLAIGALVEQESVVRDETPLFDAASMDAFYFGQSQRAAVVRLVIDAPAALPLRWVARGIPGIEPRREEHDGRVRLVFEQRNVAPWQSQGAWLPPDAVAWPHVGFTTGRSWADVASRYAEMVDAAIDTEAVRDLARAAAGDAKDPKTIAVRCVEALHRRLRYTGIEFGQSAIVPTRPALALQRGYGDCKDQAAFLVSMLRSLGIPASIALLDPGPGEDVDADLPGVGSFEHAIARVDIDPPLWIDTTDPYTPVGELPTGDQDRLALIASRTTSALVRTPLATSKDNRVLETVDVTLTETGPARIEERTEAFGVFASEYRGNYDGARPGEIEKNLKGYATRVYRADDVTDVHHSDAALLEAPYTLSFTMPKARRGFTDTRQAVAAFFPAVVVERVAQLVAAHGPGATSKGAASDGAAAASAAPPKPARTIDWMLPEAWSWERRCRVVAPPGFEVRSLPTASNRQLGPATLATTIDKDAQGVVTLTYRFDTVKQRFSPAEWELLRTGVEEVLASDPQLLIFDQIGERDVAEGRIKEGLAQFRSLVALHPSEALHHVQLARALLTAGLGDAARLEGKAGTDVEPGSGVAHRIFGFVLEHDPIARRFARGADVEGAIREMRKALELDPKDTAARAELAFLLERDALGRLAWDGPRLKESIDQYRALLADDSDDGKARHEQALLLALMRSRDWTAVRELAPKIHDGMVRDSAWIAAIAAQDGAEAALARSLQPPFDAPARHDLLAAASFRLAELRLHPVAVALLDGAGKGSSRVADLQEAADLLRKLHPFQESLLPASDPRSLIQQFVIGMLHGDPDAVKELVVPAFRPDDHDLVVLRHVRRGPDGAPAEDLSEDFLIDAAISTAKLTKDGDEDSGFRISASVGLTGDSETLVFFVVRRDGGWRIAAMDDEPEELGSEALRRVKAGDIPGARRWLDWARDLVEAGTADEPLWWSPFPRVWHAGQDGTSEQVQTAAAVLAATGSAADEALPLLKAARVTASGTQAGDLDRATFSALMHLHRYDEALVVARALVAAHPDSTVALESLVDALERGNLRDEAASVLRARLAVKPDDLNNQRMLAHDLSKLGRLDESRAMLRSLAERGQAVADDYNELAWTALFTTADPDQAIDDAQRAVKMSRSSSAALLHTLAAVLADGGRTAAARQALLSSIEADDRDDPAPEDWFVLGRIAEGYGEIDAAMAAYRKVGNEEDPSVAAISCGHLASMRLAGLAAHEDKAPATR